MSISNLIRWCGLAAIVAGGLTALMTVLSPLASEATTAVEWGFLATGLATQFGLIGIYAFQMQGSGWAGLLGFVLALSGNAFFIGPEGSVGGVESGQLGGSIYALGLLFLAIGTWRAGRFPRWIPALWVLAIIVGVPAFFSESLAAISFALGGLTFGAGFVAGGYWLWSRHAAPATM